MAKSKAKWKLVTERPITDYQCGARAGERVRLRRDIITKDHQGKPTGNVHRAGEIWTVINGAAEPPQDLWLMQPDGERHTWSDDDDFWNWFERVTDNTA